jgi:hypothetical protein
MVPAMNSASAYPALPAVAFLGGIAGSARIWAPAAA